MISDLRIQNFRSYDDDSFEFDQGVNIIVGPNASGKTNLIEGLLLVASGNSYRAKDTEIIQHDKPWSRLDVHSSSGPRTLKIVAEDGRAKKIFEFNGQTKQRLKLADTIPTVLFEPTHLQLLHGSPEKRREFIDSLLEKTKPAYGPLLRQYRRALTQRNTLLKQGSDGRQQLFAWNIRLSDLGGAIANARIQLLHEINPATQQHYQAIASTKHQIELQYQSVCAGGSYSSLMLKKLEAGEELDYLRGFTAYGPHRDDMLILFDGKPMGEVASRGETRTLLLSLKIIEATLVEDARQQKPLLLLDDVFGELDGARRKALTEFLSGHQSFITTTDADVVVEHFMDNCHVIALSK